MNQPAGRAQIKRAVDIHGGARELKLEVLGCMKPFRGFISEGQFRDGPLLRGTSSLRTVHELRPPKLAINTFRKRLLGQPLLPAVLEPKWLSQQGLSQNGRSPPLYSHTQVA